MSGGSKSNNDAIIAQQKADALKAENKELDRQERLRAGRDRIKAMFSETGGDWTGATTREYRDASGGPAKISQPNYNTYNTTGNMGRLGPTESEMSRSTYVDNPDYVPAGYHEVTGKGGTEAGIGQDFYDKFKSSITDYYQPELTDQFKNAKEQNLFDLARRGTLRSSIAADHAAELTREKAEADARLRSDAENQTAGLRQDISNAQQNALSLLQATEDPTAAANAALTETNAIQSRAPNFSPLGELFSAAARSYAGWQQNQNAQRNYSSIPTRNPYTSSGRNVGT